MREVSRGTTRGTLGAMTDPCKKPADAAAEEETLDEAAQVAETYRPTARADAVVLGVSLLAGAVCAYSHIPRHSGAILGGASATVISLYRAAYGETEKDAGTFLQRLLLVCFLAVTLILASYYYLGVPFAILVVALLWPWGLVSYLRLRRLWAEGERPRYAWLRPLGLAAAALLLLDAARQPSYHLDALTLPRAYDEERLGPPKGRSPGETRVLGWWGELRWLPENGAWIGTREVTLEQLAALPQPVRSRKIRPQKASRSAGRVPVPWRQVVDFLWRSGYRARGEGLIPPGWILRPPTSAEWAEAWQAGYLTTARRPIDAVEGSRYLEQFWAAHEWLVDAPRSPPTPWRWAGYYTAARDFGEVHRVRFAGDRGAEEGHLVETKKKFDYQRARLRLVLAPAPSSSR